MIKRATCNTWAEWFEKHEGVRIHGTTILKKLKLAQVIGENGRNRVGRLFKGVYYSEQEVRRVCADLLAPLPQVCESGFVDVNGIQHATTPVLAQNLGIFVGSVLARAKGEQIKPKKGKNTAGQIVDLYPEPAVRKACADLLGRPVCDVDGYANISDVRHATKDTFSRLFGISPNTVTSRLVSSDILSVPGRDSQGKPADLYPEPVLRKMFEDLVGKPVCGADGFTDIGGVRYGSAAAYAREYKDTNRVVYDRLAVFSVVPVAGRDMHGVARKLYPEPAVREACKDLIEKRKGKNRPPQSGNGNRQSDK